MTDMNLRFYTTSVSNWPPVHYSYTSSLSGGVHGFTWSEQRLQVDLQSALVGGEVPLHFPHVCAIVFQKYF
jgi:hypothetical protein